MIQADNGYSDVAVDPQFSFYAMIYGLSAVALLLFQVLSLDALCKR
jgi:hypothetical protein